MNLKSKDIHCPHCGKKNTWVTHNKFRPFCSERCKLIDLGDWANEKHSIPIEPDSSENNLPENDNQDTSQK